MPWQKAIASSDPDLIGPLTVALEEAVTEICAQLHALRFESAFLCRRIKRDYWETLTDPERDQVRNLLYLCGEK